MIPGASTQRLDIHELFARGAEFRRGLIALKQRLPLDGFPWYPYDSLGNLRHLNLLLTGEHRFPIDLAADAPLLDIGCADGDLAFFFESLGCEVQAVDCPATNCNRMRGIRTLKTALGSSIEIHEIDLDAQFRLPNLEYGLVFFFGMLYHLKNPFYVLEALARQARYCLLSTRVARFAPQGGACLADLPVGYLVDDTELNQDVTNFWIFSEAGLRRLLGRTRWEICDYMTVGNQIDSDPIRSEGDERAFCLLRSRVTNRSTARLLEGWYPIENGVWRWTKKRFSAAFEDVEPRESTLKLRVVVPDILLRNVGMVTLRAQAGGVPLEPETYTQSGEYVYTQPVPPVALNRGILVLHFEVDQVMTPAPPDTRRLGIIVSSLSLEQRRHEP